MVHFTHQIKYILIVNAHYIGQKRGLFWLINNNKEIFSGKYKCIFGTHVVKLVCKEFCLHSSIGARKIKRSPQSSRRNNDV